MTEDLFLDHFPLISNPAFIVKMNMKNLTRICIAELLNETKYFRLRCNVKL